MNWFMWAFFGNDTDGPTGDKTLKQGETPFMQGSPEWLRRVRWWLRNPCHNLCFFVLGVVGKKFTRVGKYPNDVFPPVGWNYCVIRYKWLWLPFIAYKGKYVSWYAGWRESGALGFKFVRSSHV